VLFVPFHYGYWDVDGGQRSDPPARAANEFTLTDWDPASRQPLFKLAAGKVTRIEAGDGTPAPAPTTTASRPVGKGVPATRGGPGAEADEQLQTTETGGVR
jgi:hypothetical protein